MKNITQQSVLAKIFHDVYGEYFNKYRNNHRINIQSLVYLLENMGINVAVKCNLHDTDHDYSFKLIDNNDELVYKQYVYSLSLGADSQAIDRFHYATLNAELDNYFSKETKESIYILRDLVKNNIDLVVLATLYYKSTVLSEDTTNIGRDYISALGRISFKR